MLERLKQLQIEDAGTRRLRAGLGFTLIELLVVIAITLVLMLLLFGPMFAGLKYTSQAQTNAAAQDGQRLLLRQIMRDLASAAAVRDTQDHYLNVMVLEKANQGDTQGTQALAHMYNGYTDIIPPRTMCQDEQSTQTGTCVETGQTVITDPTTNQNVVPTPTIPTTSGTSSGKIYTVATGVSTPVAPGSSFTRYFIGLKYPFNFSYDGKATSVAVAQPYSSIYDAQTEAKSDPYYNNTNYPAGVSGEQDVQQGDLNNTYVLYVANVSPYQPHSTNANTGLFNTSASGQPILDDPDFFRIVTSNDYLPDTDPYYNNTPGKTYGQVSATYAATHNARVYNWYKVAHQVMAGREYDLLGYARTGGNVDWGQPAATVPSNASVSVADPLTGTAYSGWLGKNSNAVSSTPFTYDTLHLVNGLAAIKLRGLTTILPAGQTGEGSQTLAADDTSQGAQQNGTSDPNQQYIPTSYTLGSGQIQGTPIISVVGDPVTTSTSGTTGTTYVTGLADTASVGKSLVNSSGTVAATDIVEYIGATPPLPSDSSTLAVYDVTQSRQIVSTTAEPFVYLAFNRTSGKVSFSVPAVPGAKVAAANGGNADPNNTANGTYYNTWWYTSLNPSAVPTDVDSVTGDLVVILDDNTQFPGNPLYQGGTSPIKPPPRVVVNSENVRGPDRTKAVTSDVAQDAINLPLVTYARVPFGSAIGPNQYSIEYRHPITSTSPTTYQTWIHLGDYGSSNTSDPSWANFINTGIAAASSNRLAAANTILVSYNVQNNTLNGAMSAGSVHATVSTPANVTASYATSSMMQVTLGFRVYDAFSGTASFLTTSTDAPVGNGTR
ncbi:MAG: prepilin-type N-terminal cleavage/methylation domain-containing protein [Capsulimonadaceae bacterium]|nr:prepilin-type N-terminal cleavage/methylation domain-containing protein [Capsulimonadaceae bacterium]